MNKASSAFGAAVLAAFTSIALYASTSSAEARATTKPSTAPAAISSPAGDVCFNTNFEGGCIGKIEPLGPDAFRCHALGQTDERGHNRQANWYYFRIDHAAGHDLTLTLTDFIGEYNGRPGAVAMGPTLRPVYSTDNIHWKTIDDMTWHPGPKEAVLHLHCTSEQVWIAHIPPYTPADLARLLADVDRSADAKIEIIGKTVRGRDLPMVTVTDAQTPDAGKKRIWLIAREHAWEAGTSEVMDGAIRFAISDAPRAVEMRRKTIMVFSPMVDIDGCISGGVRFNSNGYDVNRHWDAVDLRDKVLLQEMPEIWYTKKSIATAGRIDLMVNMHNTETAEYIDTMVDNEAALAPLRRLDQILFDQTTFDPNQRLVVRKEPADTTNSLWVTHKVPVCLMELRIGPGKKLGRIATVDDRLGFGAQLIDAMARAVAPSTSSLK